MWHLFLFLTTETKKNVMDNISERLNDEPESIAGRKWQRQCKGNTLGQYVKDNKNWCMQH